MKKIIFYAFTLFFALTLGLAYAEENGVTDFKGLTYDSGPIGTPETAMEGVNAGGMREDAGLTLDNRITDFSGKTYDTLSDIGLAPPASEPAVEGSHAGGLRDEGPAKEIFNSVTDFSGYDSN